jgi:hypothetical protein
MEMPCVTGVVTKVADDVIAQENVQRIKYGLRKNSTGSGR